MDFLILGAGYTARRVARRLVESGADVTLTNRERCALAGARCLAWDITDPHGAERLSPFVSTRTVVLHSIPIFSGTPDLVAWLRSSPPARVVYLSTTGVYGPAAEVDEHTPPNPQTEKDTARLKSEQILSDGPWTSMILRPAAIYGPGRGVHWSVRHGGSRMITGHRIVSRIHVDDLAEHAVRAMQTIYSGAYPVADEAPCPSMEVARWTCERLKIPYIPEVQEHAMGGRKVEGTAVRALLGIRLRYRSFREGVAACLAEEGAE